MIQTKQAEKEELQKRKERKPPSKYERPSKGVSPPVIVAKERLHTKGGWNRYFVFIYLL